MTTTHPDLPTLAPAARLTRTPENSTDATRGEGLVERARQRRAELAAALARLPVDAVRARGDIERALSSVDDLLTGDVENLAGTTAEALDRWLEGNKHLAEATPRIRTSPGG